MLASVGMEKALEELVDGRFWAEHPNTCPPRGSNVEWAKEGKPGREPDCQMARPGREGGRCMARCAGGVSRSTTDWVLTAGHQWKCFCGPLQSALFRGGET